MKTMNVEKLGKIYNVESGTSVDKLCLEFAKKLSEEISNPADLTVILRSINDIRNQANDSIRISELKVDYRQCVS